MSHPQSHNHDEVVAHLMPTFAAIHQRQQHILQFVSEFSNESTQKIYANR